MNKKLYWGLAALIILLGIGAVLIYQHDRAEIRQLEKELAETNKMLEDRNKAKTEKPVADVIKPSTGENLHQHADSTLHNGTHQTPIVENDVPTEAKAADGILTADEIPSAEELAHHREFQKENHPKIIEQLKKNVANQEILYNRLLKLAQDTSIPGHYDNELAKEKAALDTSRFQLRNMQNALEKILRGTHPGDIEAKEANNEKK